MAIKKKKEILILKIEFNFKGDIIIMKNKFIFLIFLLIFILSFFCGAIYERYNSKSVISNIPKHTIYSNNLTYDDNKDRYEVPMQTGAKIKKSQRSNKKPSNSSTVDKGLKSAPLQTPIIKIQRIAYLTFDDGPSETITPKILIN